MRIAINTLDASIYSPLFLEALPGTEMDAKAPRVSRMKCLNGKVALDNQGFVDGDRDFVINAKITETQSDFIDALIRNYTDFVIFNDEGAFSGMISNISNIGGNLSLTFMVEEKLNI